MHYIHALGSILDPIQLSLPKSAMTKTSAIIHVRGGHYFQSKPVMFVHYTPKADDHFSSLIGLHYDRTHYTSITVFADNF